MTVSPAVADLTRAMRLADPRLSRFDPLSRIITYDDFDHGFSGWTQLVGNYEHTLDAMLPGYAQHTQAMLSTLPVRCTHCRSRSGMNTGTPPNASLQAIIELS